MRTDNQRRSSNIEDRRGMRGGGGGGLPVRGMSLGGIIIIGILMLVLPPDLRNALLSSLSGGGQGVVQESVAPGECPAGDQACDFVSATLGSTEDVWATQFREGRLPRYGSAAPTNYQNPILVLFTDQVGTGCGTAPSSVGPFYCPADSKLYIDLSFYDVMRTRLNAPGDFAQAYVIAHEVGHHMQNLIGSSSGGLAGETENQASVRRELQADCFAGVWGHFARTSMAVDDSDLREALNAAHQIGDDTLQSNAQGHINPAQFTHGTSAQRMRWFRRGFDAGDARQCDTFAVSNYGQL